MIVVTVKMIALPAKRKELLLTIHELISLMRKEKGCLNAHVYTNAENKNVLTLVEEWKTRADVETYKQSDYFRVLLGAMKLLAESSEIKFSKCVNHECRWQVC